MHRLTWFRERYPAQPRLPVAERAGEEVLSLPLSPAHSDDDILDAIDAVRRVHARFARMKRTVRISLTVVLTVLAFAYILWKIDVRATVDVIVDASPWWFALSVGIMIGTALPMALRWKWLLAAQKMLDHFWWLTRAYFVSYSASQVLPTSIGGDAVRIYETARRHPGRTADITAIVLLERGLGGAATVLLGAIGFVLALGHYDVSAYLWLEGAFVLGTILLLFLFFARSARPLLRRSRPLLARAPARAAA